MALFPRGSEGHVHCSCQIISCLDRIGDFACVRKDDKKTWYEYELTKYEKHVLLG